MGSPLARTTPRAIRPGAVPVGRRSAPRLRLSIPATLISLHGHRRCILIDLSCTGAQVGLEMPLRMGEGAVLQIAGIEPFGEVVRRVEGQHGGVNGLVFDPPITEDEVLGVRAYSERFRDDEMRALRDEVRRWVMGT